MSYHHRTEPPEIQIGSEFVCVVPKKYGTTQTARILRRETDADGKTVLLVLDRVIGNGANVFNERTDKRDKYGWSAPIEWRASGCFATELRPAESEET